MAEGLQDKLETLNNYTQWKHTDSDRTPEAYINYLAREGALEKLEATIEMLDDTGRRMAADYEHFKDEPAVQAYIRMQQEFLVEDRERIGI